MKKSIIQRYRDMNMGRVLASLGIIAIISGFIFSAPSPTFKNELTRIAIEKIEQANANSLLSLATIAHAQEDDGYGDYGGGDEGLNDVYGCTDPTAQNHNTSANIDDGSCTYQVWGCTDPSALNFNSSATDDDSSCNYSTVHCYDMDALNYDAEEECIYEEIPGCTDSTALNYNQDATVDNATCIYPSEICCIEGKLGYVPPGLRGDNICNNDAQCIDPDPICCDGNWDNYVSPSDREPGYSCEYGPDTCQCYPPDPFGDPWQARSACGGDGDGINEYDDEDEPACSMSVDFSVIKSGVEISGTAEMSQPYPRDSNNEIIPGYICSYNEEDEAYLAGRAAADATPDTPLNTPIQLDSLSSYTVTSKDYCLNMLDIQGSPSDYNRNEFGFCCANPDVVDPATGNSCISSETALCGPATAYSTESEPISDLCSAGTPENMVTEENSYSWTCNTADDQVTCSSSRTCPNGNCNVTDLCLNPEYPGDQDSAFLTTYNLYTDSASYCWNNVSGACGSAIYGSFSTSTPPSTGLCLSPASAPTSPTLNTGVNPNVYEWTCNDINNYQIAPPSTCQASVCTGSGCGTTVSNLINLRMQPSIVSNTASDCTMTWNSAVDEDTDPNVPGVCTINGNSTFTHRGVATEIYDDNITGISVPPGSYSLTCTDSENNTETKSARCSVKPEFKEI